ncbi:MAG: hypothetical protein ACI9LV_000550 [Candidatus Nanohaloarchaea archaeon]|jgi:hypothetical protein
MFSFTVPDSVGRKQFVAVLTGFGVLTAVFMLFAFRGFVMFEATSTCQETTRLCHGIPYGDSCAGFESEKSEIVEKSQCNSVEQIEQRCGELADEICAINNRSIGTNWSDQTLVFGRTCKEWNAEYNISLRSC